MSDPDKATCKYENIDYLKTAVLEWLTEEKRVVNLKALERASSIYSIMLALLHAWIQSCFIINLLLPL